MITYSKWRQLKNRMQQLQVLETDLEEKFILGSGHGGQKVNKTASCVFLKHLPSGLTIKCQTSRFRDDNRYQARKQLCDKLEQEKLQEKSKQQQAIDKIRRQKKRRSRRAKQKMLDDKHHRSETKQLRKPPTDQ